MATLIPILLLILGVGGGLCALAWRFTRSRPVWVRLILVTLPAAVALAPGVVVGHGVAIVPVVLVLIQAILSGDPKELFQAALIPIAVEWAILYAGCLLAVGLFGLVKRRPKLVWFLAIALVGAFIAISILGRRSVGERITSVNLSGIYTNIQSYNEGRDGYVLTTGKYPSASGMAWYYLKNTGGSISISCMLEDRDAWIASRRHWETGPTSNPIGDQSFFKNETTSPETLELAYRRYNLGVCFRGQSVSAPEANRREMEEAAKALDDAILKRNPNVHLETVRLSLVAGQRAESFLFPFLWIFYLFAHPDY